MRMWEIRENMGSYGKHKYDEYEYGYEAGYRDAMKELRGAKKAWRTMRMKRNTGLVPIKLTDNETRL